MKRIVFIIVWAITFFTGCQKREWTNPFDPSCPKEMWTPANFSAVQEGTTVKLTWSQPMNNISGFKLTKKVDNGSVIDLSTEAKGISQLVDPSVTGGKVHTYTIVAYAGSNLSNVVTAQVTPTFVSTLSTTTITSVKSYTALLNSTIASDGGATVTSRGVCWSTSPNPTISNTKTSDGSGGGTFTSSLSGLSSNTTYYARSFATNSVGTAYGNQVSFKTFYGEITDIDGNVYQTVKIGNQVWMAENLKTTKYNDGTPIPNITDNTAWATLTTGAYCFYSNDAATYNNIYGAIYNWHAVSTNKLAPVGWHVPTDEEWTTLTNYLGGADVAGSKLKEVGTSHWQSPNLGATNESGFTALPGGFRGGDLGIFGNINNVGYWWTSTIAISAYAYDFFINNNSTTGKYYPLKSNGCSVRCLLGTLSLPAISTAAISDVTFESAVLGGNISSDGNSTVTERGVVYSTTPNPTTANSKVVIGSGTGSFNTKITGLSNNITYYVRAYATNAVGTRYGAETSFILNLNVPGANINDIDGNVYKTVTIGTQTWMAENLKVTKYRNGNPIPNVTDGTIWTSLVSGAWCDFTNNPTFGAIYGHLYNFYSVIDSRQLCPTGWHVPSEEEYATLLNYVGSGKVAGAMLKESGTLYWNSPNTSTNFSGFSARAGSWRGGDGSFYYWPGTVGDWWSSTAFNSTYSYFLTIASDNNTYVISSDAYFSKSAGGSIRCIKD